MEELALKPIGKVPNPTNIDYNQLQTNYITEYKLQYIYGNDVADWGMILPFTLNLAEFNTSGSFLCIFDTDISNEFTIDNITNEDTCIFTLDYGRLLDIRQIFVTFAMECFGITATDTFLAEYSEDGLTWETIGSQSLTTDTAKTYYDFIKIVDKFRYIKFTFSTGSRVGGYSRLYLNRLRVLV